MKKYYSLLLVALLPLVASAYDACIDGIYYNLNSSNNEAEVTYYMYKDGHFYCNNFSESIVIPQTITYNGRIYQVTSIGDLAFGGWSDMITITIPNSVTSIGESAFKQCYGLNSIKIPNSVTTIGKEAFAYCRGLISVTFPNSVISIGSLAFYGCDSLQKVIVPDIAVWCNNSFVYPTSNPLCYAGHLYSDEDTEITNLVIPDGVTNIGNNTFYQCSGLNSVTIPNSVTSIGDNAFGYCTGLSSINILGCVTNFSRYAFNKCSGLKKVIVPDIAAWCGILFKYADSNPLYYAHHIFSDEDTEITDLVIPEGVTSIGSHAFWGCSGLTSVTIGDSVTSIGEYAFYGCSGLTSVNIPDCVTGTLDGTFRDCTSLTSATISNGVTTLDRTFDGCSGLTSITIGSGITSISGSAFNRCDNLHKVIVPDLAAWCGISLGNENSNNPLSYAHHLFSNEETEITDLVIPDGVTSIANYAFSGCNSLTSVTIPSCMTSFGYSVFKDCSSLTSVYITDLTSWCNISFNNQPFDSEHEMYLNGQEIKELIIPNDVTSIGHNAFSGCSGLTSVTIPNSVTSIGSSAFSGCSGLTSVTIPNSVTIIGNYAFSGCSGLTSVTIGTSVTSIGEYAFRNCNALISITIPNSMTSIGDYAFARCSGLTSVTIPNSVTSIGIGAFNGCSGLTSATIPNSVTCIGDVAFYGCSGLTSVTIPNSVTSIGERAFYGCSGLTSATIGDNVTRIGKDAFFGTGWYNAQPDGGILYLDNWLMGYKGSKVNRPTGDFTIKGGTRGICDNAFWGCSGLTSITIPNSMTSIGDVAFYGCSGLTSVHISDLEAWCKITFYNANSNPLFYAHHLFFNEVEISDLVIPNSVISISGYAFSGCSGLTSITIEDGVTSIGNGSFYECHGLTSITIPNSVDSIGVFAFGDCSSLTSIKVESGNSKYDSRNNCNAIIETETNTLIAGCKNTIIPNCVTSIGDYAFYGCSGLTSITIGNSVTSIGDEAFYGCSGLTDVYCYAVEPPSVSYYFSYGYYVYAFDESHIKEHTTLHVPAESVEQYRWTEPWSRFGSIVALADEDAVMEVKALPVLIQTQGGSITIQGAAEGTPIAIYDLDGKQYGTALADKDRATIATSLRPGSIAVVKIGEKSVKVLLK